MLLNILIVGIDMLYRIWNLPENILYYDILCLQNIYLEQTPEKKTPCQWRNAWLASKPVGRPLVELDQNTCLGLASPSVNVTPPTFSARVHANCKLATNLASIATELASDLQALPPHHHYHHFPTYRWTAMHFTFFSVLAWCLCLFAGCGS
jgi:hypothetical protein